MVPKLQQFIEQHIELIEEQKYLELYRIAKREIPFQIGNLTYNLMLANINPLDDVPGVLDSMFAYSPVENVELPKNIEYIAALAFVDCYHLTEITIPSGVLHITSTSFKGCYKLKKVIFEGTKKDFSKLLRTNCFQDTNVTSVICSDGELVL